MFIIIGLRTINILLLGCYTRFSCTITKWYLRLAKAIITPPTGWTNWPMNKVHISNLFRRQIFPLLFNKSTYIISILIKLLIGRKTLCEQICVLVTLTFYIVPLLYTHTHHTHICTYGYGGQGIPSPSWIHPVTGWMREREREKEDGLRIYPTFLSL